MRHPRERAYYRVEYPIQERPAFVVDEVEMAVHDLSEHGVRFTRHPHLRLAEGETVSGLIRFRDRGELHVEGRVVWVRGDMAALELQVPVPFGTILDEQRYLRNRYRPAE
ncbi:MAG: PilZ domain-containing protein [Akkermansiaceae bacterium]|nr:PilZ domain-containing protein [Akkermansiaceae bacterium]